MSANTIGRANVLALTNKSGGGVVAGDVVVIDTANNDAFTTTTTGSYTGAMGVVLSASIANNAVGLVLLNGYTSLVNVNASVTRGHFGATHTVAKQATDAGASRGAGTFCQFLTGGTTPDAMIWQPDLGGAGVSVTTKGDLQGYSTAAARIPVSGNNGFVLTEDSTQALGVKWAAASSGALTLLEQHTASTSATLDFTTCISSTYDTYLFEILDLLPATTSAILLMRMGTGAGPSWDSTSGHYGYGQQRYNAAGGAGSGTNSDTSINITNSTDTMTNDATINGCSGFVRLYSPGSATYKKIVSEVGYKATNYEGVSGFGAFLQTTAVTGVQFLYHNGDITSGTIRAYGVAK